MEINNYIKKIKFGAKALNDNKILLENLTLELKKTAYKIDNYHVSLLKNNAIYKKLPSTKDIFGQFYLNVDTYATNLASVYVASTTDKFEGFGNQEIFKYWRASQNYHSSKKHLDAYFVKIKTDLIMSLWISFESFITYLDKELNKDEKQEIHKTSSKQIIKNILKELDIKNIEKEKKEKIIKIVEQKLNTIAPHSSFDKKISSLLKGRPKTENKPIREFIMFFRDIRNFSHNNFISNKDKKYEVSLMNECFEVQKEKQIDFMKEELIVKFINVIFDVNKTIFKSFQEKQEKNLKISKTSHVNNLALKRKNEVNGGKKVL
jgi:hypothetical protein